MGQSIDEFQQLTNKYNQLKFKYQEFAKNIQDVEIPEKYKNMTEEQLQQEIEKIKNQIEIEIQEIEKLLAE